MHRPAAQRAPILRGSAHVSAGAAPAAGDPAGAGEPTAVETPRTGQDTALPTGFSQVRIFLLKA